MSDSLQTPHEAAPRVSKDYEDALYHDEDEVSPVEEADKHVARPAAPSKRRPGRLPPPPRRFYAD